MSDNRSKTSAINGLKGGHPKGVPNKPTDKTKMLLGDLRAALQMPEATPREILAEVVRLAQIK